MKEVNVKDILEPQDKNKYEQSIIAFADNLDEKLKLLKKKRNEVDSTFRSLYQAKIDYLTQKRDLLMERIDSVKATSEEKWKETHATLDDELKKVAMEAEAAYTGIKSGFSYLFEKLQPEKS